MREMKDSGVAWIGEIPREWEVSKAKYYVENLDGFRVPIDAASRLPGEYPYWGAGSITDYVNDYLFDETLILLGEDGAPFFDPYRPVAFLINERVWVNNHIHVLRPQNKIDARYMTYYLNIVDYRAYINGSILNKLTQGNFNKIAFILPSIKEQQRIADYLDEKCSKIDEIISKQDQIIDKLTEYKSSLLNEMFTDISSKTSTCHIGFLGAMKNGLNYSDTVKGQKVKFLGVGNFKDYYYLNSPDLFSTIQLSEDFDEDYYLKNGDIIFVRSNGSKELVGRAVMVDNIDYPVTYSGFCIRFRNTRQDVIDSRYLLYFFRTPYFRKQLEKYSYGSNISNMNQDLLSQISIAFPSKEKQERDINKTEIRIRNINENIEKRNKVIELLYEYKKSLIYEVVTGKKEV